VTVAAVLSGCSLGPGTTADSQAADFDQLARHVPNNAETPFFFDFKPEGEVERRWTHMRQRLEADPTTAELLAGLLAQYKVEAYGLEGVIEGPAVAGYWEGAQYAILQVGDERAAREVLIANLGEESAWDQTEYNGRILYQGRFLESGGGFTHLTWAVADGLVFLVYRTDYLSTKNLQRLLSLPEDEAMATLPTWQAQQRRLPDDLLGLAFVPFDQLTNRSSEPYEETDALARLPWYMDSVVLMIVPEEAGIRVAIDGVFAPHAEEMPELKTLFDLPPVDAAAWPGLPADTAVAVITRNAAAVMPWLRGILGLESSYPRIRETISLDLESDLLAEGGPLEGAFAAGLMPPQPGQPVLGELPALQILITSPDTTVTQADALGAAMEGRDAVLGDDVVEGVSIHRQVGTEMSGYAVAYGFDGDVFYLGSSPDAIGKGAAAQRDGTGMGNEAAYQVLLDAMPGNAFFTSYVQGGRLLEVLEANVPVGAENVANLAFEAAAAFDGIGLSLSISPERIEGVFYLVLLD
jgi:hypothetical protein